MMRRANVWITGFVIGWSLLFHYETLRLNYLSPLVRHELPKFKFLFPPAGWIMFYHIDPSYGFAQVYGIRHGQPIPIDPHEIFETRAIGYDNIHRNVLVGVISPAYAQSFCSYLHRKFPDDSAFTILYGEYPDLINAPDRVQYHTAYRCHGP